MIHPHLRTTIPSLTVCLFLLMACLGRASAQSLPQVWELNGTVAAQSGVVWDFGDLDGDGCTDYLESLRDTTSLAATANGGVLNRVVVVSGADGSDLRVFADWGDPPFPKFILRLGDLDGDGVAEFAFMNILQFFDNTATTDVELYSGLATSPYMTLTWPGWNLLGQRLQVLGDVNNDGVDDLGFGGILGFTTPLESSYFEVRSGVDGSTLFAVESDTIPLSSMAALGDVNGDQHDDFIISSNQTSHIHPGVGSASILSGANFSPLRHFFGAQAGEGLGSLLLPLSDADGDGVQDVLITSGSQDGGVANKAVAYSCVTGAALWTIFPQPGDFFSVAESNGDLDGDGFDDFALTSRNTTPFFPAVASRQVHSGSDGSAMMSLTPAGFLTGFNSTADMLVGDSNKDGIAEIATLTSTTNFVTPVTPLGSTQVIFRQSRGAEAYGNATPGSSLDLAWVPQANRPRQGFIELTGALPNAALFFGVSVAPWNGATFGAGHPLWISPLPQDLFLTTTVMADSFGSFRSFDTLTRPSIAGISLYVQAAQTTLPDAVSNGLQLLYGD